MSAVVFGDGAAAVKGTSETGLPLHTAPEQSRYTHEASSSEES